MSKDRQHKRDYSRVNTRVREHRREQAQVEWRKQPLSQFIKQKESEVIDRQLRAMKRTISRFEKHLIDEIAAKEDADIQGVRDVVEDDVRSFRDNVLKKDSNLNNRTVSDRLSFLSQFYNVLERQNAIAGNPVARPLKEFRENHDTEADRPHIPFARMKHFVNWLTQPFSRAFWLCGLKHGTRLGESINIDLRCLHIDHPVFWEIIDEHDVRLDPRIRDRPDTILIYEQFNEKTEIPNEDRPGPETEGEVRESGNKRKEDGGSILPLDSELKTALLEWLLVRPPTYDLVINPLFTTCANARRATKQAVHHRLWKVDNYVDSIQNFAEEERIEKCPTCGEELIEENLADADKPGRRFRCRRCRTNHWRSIFWDNGLVTAQKMTYHQARHYFTNAHSLGYSELHDGVIPDKVRKKRIRGDSNSDGDTEDQTYKQKKYENYDEDIREPYLSGIYKFDLYDNPIRAVGEGWES
jgi:integrase